MNHVFTKPRLMATEMVMVRIEQVRQSTFFQIADKHLVIYTGIIIVLCRHVYNHWHNFVLSVPYGGCVYRDSIRSPDLCVLFRSDSIGNRRSQRKRKGTGTYSYELGMHMCSHSDNYGAIEFSSQE